MSKGNYKDFRIALADYYRVGKTSQHEAFDAAGSGYTWHGCQGDDFFLKKIERRIDGALKFCTQPGAFFFVPRCSLDRFIHGRLVDAQRAH